MNKKLSLGLLVLFTGFFMVACGDDNSTSTTTNITQDLPESFESFNYGCTNCDKELSGTYYVQNRSSFADAFDLNLKTSSSSLLGTNSGSSGFNLGDTGNIITDLLSGISGIAGNYINCQGENLQVEIAEQLYGTDFDGCDPDSVYGDDDDDLDDTYSAKVILAINSSNEVTGMVLRVSSDSDYEEDIDVDLFDTSDVNTFETSDGDIEAVNEDGTLRLRYNGTSIGYIRF